MDNPNLRKLVEPYQFASTKKSLWQLLSTLFLFVIGVGLMWWSQSVSYFLTFALAVPTAFFSVRLFIFQHDCGHGSFFASRKWNDRVGTVLGISTATPYTYWRHQHGLHHSGSGNLEQRGFGDIDTKTVSEYLELSWAKRLGYRFYRSPLVLFGVGPAFMLLIRHRWPGGSKTNKQDWLSVHVTNVGLLAMIVVASFIMGFGEFMMIWLSVLIISGTAGIWLFYVQHQFEETYWRREPEWDFTEASVIGSSYFQLPKVLQWLTGNIGYHHIHHLSPKIPNYRLEKCFNENEAIRKVTIITFWQSVKTLKLKLWDESAKRMVSFRELRKRHLV